MTTEKVCAWCSKEQGRIDPPAAGVEPDLIACDLTQFERGHENRPMCCGVFNDWSPNAAGELQPPPNNKK